MMGARTLGGRATSPVFGPSRRLPPAVAAVSGNAAAGSTAVVGAPLGDSLSALSNLTLGPGGAAAAAAAVGLARAPRSLASAAARRGVARASVAAQPPKELVPRPLIEDNSGAPDDEDESFAEQEGVPGESKNWRDCEPVFWRPSLV